jgi:hypothetical protein
MSRTKQSMHSKHQQKTEYQQYDTDTNDHNVNEKSTIIIRSGIGFDTAT